MKTLATENLSKFFYDCAKVTFAVLIVGALTRKPLPAVDLLFGFCFTALLVIVALVIEHAKGGI